MKLAIESYSFLIVLFTKKINPQYVCTNYLYYLRLYENLIYSRSSSHPLLVSATHWICPQQVSEIAFPPGNTFGVEGHFVDQRSLGKGIQRMMTPS
jgi:hypothetical protein